MPSLADLVRKNLDAAKPDADRPSGIRIWMVLAWRAGTLERALAAFNEENPTSTIQVEGGPILDPSGSVIEREDGETIAELMLRP
ncbi:MAG: hypothetical protein JW839_21450, partial [Candidatus Lokiarchaeota archaeon]|nr:hypothetical protein [Candidatus Lokiarchaeota archaeon]